MASHEVVIDGVRYVPVVEASPSARDLMRALAAMWWGWTDDIDDIVAKYGKSLRVLVTDDDIDDENESLEGFVAVLLQHMSTAQARR